MKYTVSFEVECTPQDDFERWQPDTVNAQVVGTDVGVVGSYDMEALHMLVRFLSQGMFAEHAAEVEKVVRITKSE